MTYMFPGKGHRISDTTFNCSEVQVFLRSSEFVSLVRTWAYNLVLFIYLFIYWIDILYIAVFSCLIATISKI